MRGIGIALRYIGGRARAICKLFGRNPVKAIPCVGNRRRVIELNPRNIALHIICIACIGKRRGIGIGAVVVVKGSSADAVKAFAYDCCLHIAAFTPAYTSKNDVPQSYIDEQAEIFKAQMDQDEKMAGKPDNVKQGILQGKVNKHLAEICFEDQMFVKDDKKTVTAKLAEVGKENGATLSFASAKLYVLGK